MSFFDKRNSAITDNPPSANGRAADIHITYSGSSFYYAVLAFEGFVGLVLLGASFSKRRTDRIFFYLCAGACLVSAISYYAMGSNLGSTPITVEFDREDPRVRGLMRQIFWTRYVDWFITTPLLLLCLLFTAGVPGPTVLFTLFMNEIMIVCGLVGAVTSTKYKWGFFAFGMTSMCYVFYVLLSRGRKYARHLGNDVSRTYTISLIWTLIVWICYPICWGVSEGGNIIAPDSEAVYYGVLDMLAKPFFSMVFLFLHRKIEPRRLGLRLRDYDEDFGMYGHHKRSDAGLSEKSVGPVAHGPPTVGNNEGVRPTTAGSHHTTTTNPAAHPVAPPTIAVV